jgi:hypothetical protein
MVLIVQNVIAHTTLKKTEVCAKCWHHTIINKTLKARHVEFGTEIDMSNIV